MLESCWIGPAGHRVPQSEPGFDAAAHLRAFEISPSLWLPLAERMAEQRGVPLKDAVYAISGALGFTSVEQRAALLGFGLNLERTLYDALTDRYPVEV